ncbi:hypothetical protein DFH06DRAFT_1143866 [Mycena polygramma]|nr:hypothetical protein DFH06DRAFT_1143866 [Mycena polygramma]
MPPQPSVTQIRLNNITKCLNATAGSLKVLASGLREPYLEAISYTTQSLLKNLLTIKQNKATCLQLLEQTNELLNAIFVAHMKPDTGAELPPSVLGNIGKSQSIYLTLRKVHAFIEAQQKGSKIRRLFHQGELGTLLKNCKEGLQEGLDSFQIDMAKITRDITDIQKEAEKRQEEILHLIETLSDTGSDGKSTISRLYSGSYNSSTSISMLPSEPKIFHGRDSEVVEIIQLFKQGVPRVAILGAGGMGKTTIARVVLHNLHITAQYGQHRHFVACDSATTKVEVAALIGAHLGLKPGKDLTRAVLQFFAMNPASLLILDNLETAWDPLESRNGVEEFLSLLTDVKHLALLITMRGAERPAKVAWSHPFLTPLRPLDQDAAHQIFTDIVDGVHNPEEVNNVLALTDNMPLAISLIAHLVDSEGCSTVLSRWKSEKTSIISDGWDKKSNLDLSISLSLSSTRLKTFPHSQRLLSLLSMLPNGLSDVDLMQSQLSIDNILGCKATLLRTSLAYTDSHKRLRVLVPIREYMQKIQPPTDDLIRPLRQYFQKLLELQKEFFGTSLASAPIARISPNLANIQNVLRKGLYRGHPDLVECIYCTFNLNGLSCLIGQGVIPLISEVRNVFPLVPCNHRLEACFITEQLTWNHHSVDNLDALVSQALTHFGQCDDTDLQSGNRKKKLQALHSMAWINWYLGYYSRAQAYAQECQRLGRVSADLYGEAQGLRIEAICWRSLGDFSQSLSLCDQARDLLASCGMSHSTWNHHIMNTQAEVHMAKSEYTEARNIHYEICQATSMTENSLEHAFASLNLAEIDLSLDVPKDAVQQRIDDARSIFAIMAQQRGLIWCDIGLADLTLREGDILAARALFLRCLKSDSGNDAVSHCLFSLGDLGRWGDSPETSNWATVLLAYSLHSKERLLIYKALLCLGQICHGRADDDTATSLFNVALEGFTNMDVHRSRGECMLYLGDIFKGRGDLLKAVELWDTARPLFERSSQGKQVKKIGERLASVGEDLLEQHRKSLALLAELKAQTAIIEEEEDDVSDIEDFQEVDDEKENRLVVA